MWKWTEKMWIQKNVETDEKKMWKLTEIMYNAGQKAGLRRTERRKGSVIKCFNSMIIYSFK